VVEGRRRVSRTGVGGGWGGGSLASWCIIRSSAGTGTGRDGMARIAWGAGLATEAADGTTLDAWFRWLGWGEDAGGAPADVDRTGWPRPAR
jgi:hypothetical protein